MSAIGGTEVIARLKLIVWYIGIVSGTADRRSVSCEKNAGNGVYTVERGGFSAMAGEGGDGGRGAKGPVGFLLAEAAIYARASLTAARRASTNMSRSASFM